MSEDTVEVWRALKVDNQERRAANRTGSLGMLQEAGYAPEVKNRGAHLVLHVGDKRFDLWPGTGKWVESLNHEKPKRGVRSLLKRLRAVTP